MATETLDDFLKALCKRMGWEPTAWRLSVLREMARQEGNVDKLTTMWNPLSTTMPGGEDTNFDIGYGAGNWNWNEGSPVKVYKDMATGVEQTAKTLEGKYYPNLRQSLKEQRFVPGVESDLSSWGWKPGGSASQSIVYAMQGKPSLGVVESQGDGGGVQAAGAGGEGITMSFPDKSSPRYYGTKVETQQQGYTDPNTGEVSYFDVDVEVPDPTQFNMSLYNQDVQSWKELTGQGAGSDSEQISALSNYLDSVLASLNAQISAGNASVSQASQRFNDQANVWQDMYAAYTNLAPYTIPKGVKYIPGFGPGEFGAQYGGAVEASPITLNPFQQAVELIQGMPPPVEMVDASILQSPEVLQAEELLRQFGMGNIGGGNEGYLTPGPVQAGGYGSSEVAAAPSTGFGMSEVPNPAVDLAQALATSFAQMQNRPVSGPSADVVAATTPNYAYAAGGQPQFQYGETGEPQVLRNGVWTPLQMGDPEIAQWRSWAVQNPWTLGG